MITKGAAKEIRLAIVTARTKGWRKPAPMINVHGGLEYERPLYGRAWERTMRKLGIYPPQPPKGRSGVSSKRQTVESFSTSLETAVAAMETNGSTVYVLVDASSFSGIHAAPGETIVFTRIVRFEVVGAAPQAEGRSSLFSIFDEQRD
jgi:hypothetical protein